MSDSSIVLLLLLSSNLRVTLQSSGVVSSINKLRCFSGVGFVIRAMHLPNTKSMSYGTCKPLSSVGLQINLACTQHLNEAICSRTLMHA